MSNELDPTINGRSISELKVVELKEELSKRGLSKAGNKNVLYDRLKKFLLDESGDANVTLESIDSSQVVDTPNSPPANPLVAEYLAKQEAALREARKDAEAALRSSSGDETSPSSKKVLRGRKSVVSNVDTEDTVIERRTTRSKARSEAEQAQETIKAAGKVTEVKHDMKILNNEVGNAKGESLDVRDTGRISKKAESGESRSEFKEIEETTTKSGENVGGEVAHEARKASEVADPSASTGAVDQDEKNKINLDAVVDDVTFGVTTAADGNVDATPIVSSEDGVSTSGAVADTTNVEDVKVCVKSAVTEDTGVSIHSNFDKDGNVKIEAEPTSAADSVISPTTTSTSTVDVTDNTSKDVKVCNDNNKDNTKKEIEPVPSGDEVQESDVKIPVKMADIKDTFEEAQRTDCGSDKNEQDIQKDGDKQSGNSEITHYEKIEDQKPLLETSSDAVEDNGTNTVAISDVESMEVDKGINDESSSIVLQLPQTSNSEPEVIAVESSSTSRKSVGGDVTKVERKRRWKETSSSQDSNDDKDVITVSATKTSAEIVHEPDDSEYSDVDEKAVLTGQQQNEFEAKDAILGTDAKDEELDYEEEHIFPTSESSKPAKADDDEPPKKIRNNGSEGGRSTAETEFDRRHEVLSKKKASDGNGQDKKDNLSEDGGKQRRVSPARYPVSEVFFILLSAYLLIRQLTRPFTVKQLKGMLSNYGTLVEDGFWIDNIKSKCIVKYSSKEEATVARGSLHNLVWPFGNPKELKVDFIDEAGVCFFILCRQDVKEDLKSKANGNIAAQPSVSLRVSAGNEQRVVQKKQEGSGDSQETAAHNNTKSDHSPNSRHELGHGYDSSHKRQESARTAADYHRSEPEPKAKTADELFQKTKTQPAIYFSPLTDEQILEREKQKASETETSLLKRTTQTSRSERHKDEDSEKDNKYRLSPWRRQRSPSGQRKRRPSRSRSPRRP
uniref:SAP domain-containing protein n=1 Tax=Syphacia muris TaxID=451379 RepID=A0A0N5AI75_9BILA